MLIGNLYVDPMLLTGILAGTSASLAVLVALWPLLAQTALDARIESVVRRRAGRRNAAAPKSASLLRADPGRFILGVVQKFNLGAQARDPVLLQTLLQAGFRGEKPAVTFVAARLLCLLAALVLIPVYLFWVLGLEYPLALKILISIVGGAMGYYLPQVYVQNRTVKRNASIRRAWPNSLDLLLICVESGMSVEAAFRKVAQEIADESRELSYEFSVLTAELSYLSDRAAAYQNLGKRIGLDSVHATVTSLVQAEHYGTPVGHALRVLSQENRDMRMAEAERRAAALPPKLTVPMIAFFLPVLFAVILTPAIIDIMELR
ncbi:type II secretion system F family protein [Meridianimarinicoccus sp. RP-17]|uniref:type II secretion system F family protein n=1 Tax=Meridianimarinicoccus zhengii TaxID=2056810 RepID=UPI000DAEB8C3|nr:type II secretion system F family protein [Phycocomes zhengii]